MKKTTLALAILAATASSAALAASPNVKGGTSNSTNVEAHIPSNHIMFNGQNSGLRLGAATTYIDIAGGPVNGSNTAIADPNQGNGGHLKPVHMGLPAILNFNIAQVWKDEISTNGTNNNEYANFAVNSVRQITQLEFAPQFGGLVIGQVGENTSGPGSSTTLLPVGEGVYFGEWAPRATGTPPDYSTNLNMTSSERTVWYVGDNAVADNSMPTLVNAVYGVIGINQTGTDAAGNVLPGGLPGNQNFYTGKLTANYGSGTGSITGTIDRGSSSINFAGTSIGSNGTFNNGHNIEGRFYNNADALAGIYTGGASAADHVAFGGSKITP